MSSLPVLASGALDRDVLIRQTVCAGLRSTITVVEQGGQYAVHVTCDRPPVPIPEILRTPAWEPPRAACPLYCPS